MRIRIWCYDNAVVSVFTIGYYKISLFHGDKWEISCNSKTPTSYTETSISTNEYIEEDPVDELNRVMWYIYTGYN